MAKYYANKAFVIENYNQAKPFASFLPAVAGLYGKPLWAYYVNRGQCVSTFGVHNKDHAIMEFNPANKAFRFTEREGFRTFLNVKRGEETCFYEPFRSKSDNCRITQNMTVASHDLCIEDINREFGIKTNVMFCTLPGEKLAALIRKVTITNLSGDDVGIEVVDGMSVIIPHYLEDMDIKMHSNLRQAWMEVSHQNKIPFYNLAVLPDDDAETTYVTGGNFYMSFCFDNGKPILSKMIIDPSVLFDYMTDFSHPVNFTAERFSIPEDQAHVGLTPCGFGWNQFCLEPGAAKTIYTLAGYADSYDKVEGFFNDILSERYLADKIEENRLMIDRLKQFIFTVSASEQLNMYCGQTMLDNILRGGRPTALGGHNYYVYSRKHGDLEREYNFFQIDSTYFSQGNANFRDVNQNRRNDVMFFPFIEDANVKTFFNLIQLDGYNPLVVKGSSFRVPEGQPLEDLLEGYIAPCSRQAMKGFLLQSFIPGSLLEFMEKKGISPIKGLAGDFLARAVSIAVKTDEADFKEGYWVDHWTYNTDLLTRYLAVFPDKAESILFDDKDYYYYDSYHYVVGRSEKYVLTERGVRQYSAVKIDKNKQALIANRDNSPFFVRKNYGKGEIYKTTLIAKIFNLLINKIASLDAEGVGVEMEADKPGWCDALNGLPGILGSSINESAEIVRLVRLILRLTSSTEGNRTVMLHEELYDFYIEMKMLTDLTDSFTYWDKSGSAKEAYRAKVFYGVSGRECGLSLSGIRAFLEWTAAKADAGLHKAYNSKNGVFSTYFINQVSEYALIREAGEGEPARVQVLSFEQRPVVPFLEGQVHVMRAHPEKAKNLYEAVKETGLYDKKLDMYKVNENIMNETKEIGRQNIFPRGWLENESVFLHMEYKYFLELLRAGLYKEFFHYFRNSTIPFLDPARYGRSIYENCTFIVSSAHPDPKIHGSGYVARLTGASAEFLSMWLYMTVGQSPFALDADGNLTMELRPVLPGWLFTENDQTVDYFDSSTESWRELELPAGRFAFNFLGRILTVYHNINRGDTFGSEAVKIKRMALTDPNGTTELKGGVIGPSFAYRIRNGEYTRIDAYFE